MDGAEDTDGNLAIGPAFQRAVCEDEELADEAFAEAGTFGER